MAKMSKFIIYNLKKREKYVQNRWCVKINHYVKFEYKGMETIAVTDYTKHTPSKHFGWKKCLSSTNPKNEKIL